MPLNDYTNIIYRWDWEKNDTCGFISKICDREIRLSKFGSDVRSRQTSGFDRTCYTMCITNHSKVQHHTYCASWLYLFASVAMTICPVNGIERRRSATEGGR